MKLILMAALTVDGKIGRTDGHFPDWTEPEDKKLFMTLSREAGVIILGRKTFETLKGPLPGRRHVVLTREIRPSENREVVFTDLPPAEILKTLEQEGFTSAILAGGAEVNTLFAREGLIDEVVVTWTGILFGQGPSLFSEPLDMPLELLDHGRIGKQTLFARYRVLR